MSPEAIELINALKKQKEELATQLDRLTCERNEQAQTIEEQREQIDDLLRRLYGRKSKRFEHPDQLDLLKELGLLDEPKAAPKPALQEISYKRKRPEKPGPKPLPEHLPREVIHIDPPEEERIDASGCPMERVGEVVTEELDIIPPQFRVKRYVQGLWRSTNMNRDRVEPLPPRPIEKGRASVRLLAYLVISKYLDHLPLNRQEQIFKRHGVHLPRSTMDEWLGALSPLLQPILEAMKRRLVAGSYLQLDETPIEALDRALKGKTKRCYLWSYGIPRGEVIYDVTESRAGRHPRRFLEGFRGHVQADGYAGFNELFSSGSIEHIACMSHIRRKLFEAKHASPERVEALLSVIQALYAIEARAKEEKLEYASRHKLRQAESTPLLSELRSQLDALAPVPTPKSLLGKAVRYAQGQWDALYRYVEVGEAEIDNNDCERSLRPAVVGRGNWLFFGSAKAGGERAAVLYSLTQSAKRLGLNVFEYLSDVLARVAVHPHSRIDELTPLGWKRAREAAENLSSDASL